MSARLAALALGIVALPAAGCSYNPGYFPYLLPPGPIQQTHAKPRGPGYFRDFDPKARRLEVRPANATAPLGAQIVLVATVFDKDGEARRDSDRSEQHRVADHVAARRRIESRRLHHSRRAARVAVLAVPLAWVPVWAAPRCPAAAAAAPPLGWAAPRCPAAVARVAGLGCPDRA